MLTAPEFSIDLTSAPGSVVVSVHGDLDAATAPQLREALDDLVDYDRDRDLIVDMRGLTFIDSSGVYVLVQVLKLLRSGGRDLTLSGATPGAFKVLDVCGGTSVFDAPFPSTRSPDSNGQR